MVHMEAWLNKVDEIAAEGPSYKLRTIELNMK